MKQYVYFARNGRRIKIGLSSQPLNRMAQLGKGTRLIGILNQPGSLALERKMHGRFSAYAIRRSKSLPCGKLEWFRSHPELIAFIAENASIPIDLPSNVVFNQTVPATLHRRIRVKAAIRGISIRTFLIEALESHLRRIKETAA